MKRIILSIATAMLAFVAAAPEASARSYGHGSSTYVSHRARCGCPVYVQRYVAYRDHWGRPVWRTRVLPVSHRCGYGRGHYHRPYQPPHHHHGHGYGHRGGVSIRATW